ncbi:MAG: hypothetical protein ABSG65_35395, partial [Bryobacteraceae bacterium]
MGEANHGGTRVTGNTSSERSELTAVLASPTFARAQRLVKLLEYICEKHFDGQDAQVCEYSIATDVLGRPANFDPAEDAIARVEIHRLRKKLREYYAAEGSRQALKIIIPPGMYTPVFQQDGGSARQPAVNGKTLEPAVRITAEAPAEPALDEPESPPSMPIAQVPGKRRVWVWAAAIMAIAVIAVGVIAVRNALGHQP